MEPGSVYEANLMKLLNKDPSAQSGCSHWEDGSHPRTQELIMSNPEYGAVLQQTLHEVYINQPEVKLVTMYCIQALHRSDTMGRHLTDILNRLENDQHFRIFNCKFFNVGHNSISLKDHPDGLDTAFDKMVKWLNKPLSLIHI